MNHTLDKKYFFLRDQMRCFYSQKTLKLGQVTLDHYLPRSKGGTYDTFNLVTSCKRCNEFKGSKIPIDVEEVQLTLLKQQIKDGHLKISVPKLSPKALKQVIQSASHLHRDGEVSEVSEVSGDFGKLWIKSDTLYRYEGKHPLPTRAVLSLLLSFVMAFFSPAVYAEPTPVNFDPLVSLNSPYDYSAQHIYKLSQALAQRYPDTLRLVPYGESVDKRPLFALVLGDTSLPIDTPNRSHYFIEAGMHAREVINPVVLLSIIEGYCMDTVLPNTLAKIDVSSMLKTSVFHFVPLSNPDGFNLAKFGLSGLKTKEVKTSFSKIGIPLPKGYKGYVYLKANARGVDLNRNFEDLFYKVKTNQWVSIWNQKQNQYVSTRPSAAFYAGPRPNSEPETKSLTDYLSKIPLCAAISLHSRGQVIYWNYWMHDKTYNAKNLSLAKEVAKYTKYALSSSRTEDSASGYMGDWIANVMQIPVITMETTPSGTHYDTSSGKIYTQTKALLNPLPEILWRWGERQPKPQYWLYVNNKYLRGYSSEIIAKAYAKLLKGEVWTSASLPETLTSPLAEQTPPTDSRVQELTKITWGEVQLDLKTHLPHITTWPDMASEQTNTVTLAALKAYVLALKQLTSQGTEVVQLPSIDSFPTDTLTEDGEYLSRRGVIPLILWLRDTPKQ